MSGEAPGGRGPLSPADLQAVLEALPEAVVVAEAGSGRIRWANRSADQLFGGAVLGQGVGAVHPEAARGAAGEAFSAVAAGRVAEVRVRSEVEGPGGVRRAVEIHGVRVARAGGAGGAGGDLVAGLLRDVSAELAAQAGQRTAERRLASIIEGIPVGLVAADAETRRFVFVNESFEALLGHPPGALVGMVPADIHPPEVMARVAAEFERMMAGQVQVVLDLPVLRRDGSVFPADVHRVGILLDERLVVLAAFVDQSARQAQAALIAQQQERLEAALTAARAGFAVMDLVSGRVFPDAHWLRMRGVASAEVPAEGLRAEAVFAWVDPEDLPELKATAEACLDGRSARLDHTYRIRHADGGLRWVRSLAQVSRRDPQGGPLALSGIDLDVTEQRSLAERLAEAPWRDLVTGLPNRAALREALLAAMGAAQAGQPLAVVCLDLDGFGALEQRLGAAVSDELLAIVGQRLQAGLSNPQHLARLGGDEFAVVLRRADPVAGFEGRARALLGVVAGPIRLGGEVHRLTACAGLVTYPQGVPVSPDQLLRQAGEALIRAKRRGPDQIVRFDPQGDAASRARRAAVAALSEAMASRALVLYFQPKVQLQTGALWGLEALLRWQHPERGLLGPGAFLPALAGDPILQTLGRFVLEAALRQLARWRSQGFVTSVSVNIDAVELSAPGFAAQVLAALDQHPEVAPQQLEVEILESSAIGDLEAAGQQLAALQERGVGVSLDDFGTGYASLGLLTRLPVGTVKLDQSFVRGLPASLDDAMAIDAVVGLARGLDRALVAEGIETEDQGAHLIALGCVLGQGFFIGRPMPASEVPAWRAAWRPPARWQQAQPASALGRRLLLVEWQHQRWLAQLQAHAADPAVAPPTLAAHACRVGRWLGQEGQPGFALLRRLHGALHAQAEVWARGEGPGDGLAAVAAASEAFLSELAARRAVEAASAPPFGPMPTPVRV